MEAFSFRDFTLRAVSVRALLEDERMKFQKLVALFCFSMLLVSLSPFLFTPSVEVFAAPIFTDGFEKSNFSAWRTTEGSTAVVTSAKNSGAYAANTTGSRSDLLYFLSSPQSTSYVRGYFRFPALPTNNKEEIVMMVLDPSWTVLGACGLANWGGTYYWRLWSPPNYYNSAAATIKKDTWYCFELRITAGGSGTGIVALWIDGVQVRSSTTETINGNAKYVKCGTVFANDAGYKVYSDDYVIDTAYIGPIDVTAPTFGSITSNSTVAGAGARFSCALTDETSISGYKSSTNNTGAWINQTWTSAPGKTVIGIFDLTLNNIVGNIVSVKVYANDTVNNWGVSSQYNFTTARALSSGFIIKAVDTYLNTIKPGDPSYVSNWASILKGTLGVNTLRLFSGGAGDVWHINMIKNPTTWAVNLESLLSTVNAAGFKCYFYSLGDAWGGELGINDQAANIPATMDITTAKSYIDKLAGYNSLNHNFIADSRIAMWSVANEVDFGNPASPNSNYYWTIGVCDYIRSYGGKTTVPSARVGEWGTIPIPQTEPMLRGHVDYLEMHYYGIWQLANWFSLGNNQYNWAGWKSWLKGGLQTIMNSRGSFSVDQVIMGEFGMWRGSGSGIGLTAYSFTDQNRIGYYTNYFAALREVGFKNACFHVSIEDNSHYGENDFCRYGMITPVPDGIHFTGPAGQPYPGVEVITANFS